MRKKKTLLLVVSLLLVVALFGTVLTGCGGNKQSSNNNATQEKKPILIGGVAPVTGPAATFGKSTKQGYEMALEEWNAKGGVLGRTVKLIFEDDKADPTEAANAFSKLINENHVVAIVGSVTSSCSLAGAPIAQRNKVPMITPTSTNVKVTEQGDYIFRACFIDPFQGTVAAKFLYNNLKARKVGVIYDIGQDYNAGLAESFKKKFESLGGQIIAYEGYPDGTTDFNTQLTKILDGKPDAIYSPNYYNDDGLIAKQARSLGFNGPIVGGDGWDSPDLVKIGGDAVNNCYFTNHFSKESKEEIVQNFVKKYEDKYGEAPDALAALGYDGMNIMLTAIQNAGSTDGEAIKDALKNIDYQGVTGHIKFDENRNPIKSAVILKIENGKQVYVTTINP
ncbi:MAG: ABC transporter substrate-binding protein [Caldisericaceae bacterium]|nr:ABC transporter substrate-binding protein [Caldisericaceae bacterium]